jgi:hypothetical protein
MITKDQKLQTLNQKPITEIIKWGVEMTVDKYQKELLYRKVKCKAIKNMYLKKIHSLLEIGDENIILTGISEADLLIERFNSINLENIKHKYRVNASDVYSILEKFKKNDNPFFIFIDDDWRCCGALVVPSLSIIKNTFFFGDLVSNDLMFISTDLTHRVNLDYYEMDENFYIDVTEY